MRRSTSRGLSGSGLVEVLAALVLTLSHEGCARAKVDRPRFEIEAEIELVARATHGWVVVDAVRIERRISEKTANLAAC